MLRSCSAGQAHMYAKGRFSRDVHPAEFSSDRTPSLWACALEFALTSTAALLDFFHKNNWTFRCRDRKSAPSYLGTSNTHQNRIKHTCRPFDTRIRMSRSLRACMVCGVIQTASQFTKVGCPNCDTFLEMRDNPDTVQETTSQVFEGMISMADPLASWVAKWQRSQGYVAGLYAVKVVGLVSTLCTRCLTALYGGWQITTLTPFSCRMTISRPRRTQGCSTFHEMEVLKRSNDRPLARAK